MGLTDMLAGLAVRRTHVLIAEVPGNWTTRAALQRHLLARGWREAPTPADSDVLAVCGAPGPELSEVIDRLWDQLPGPRARVDVADASVVEAELDRAAAMLLDGDAQRRDARSRPQRPVITDESDDGDGMDHGDMDHGDMDMAPEGIPLAQGGDDRDGLEMDLLHVRLGPVLAHWPPGLLLRCTLSGDVVTAAEARVVDGLSTEPPRAPDGAVAAARECDHIYGVLALAGWPQAAATARRCRDLLLTEQDPERAALLMTKLQRGVQKSRLLRWSLRDVAPLTAETLAARHLPVELAGDTHGRLLTRLRVTMEMVSNQLTSNPLHADTARLLDALQDLVRGLDVATARLAVAGLGIETAMQAQVGAL